MASEAKPDLSALILTKNEAENLSILVPRIWKVFADLGLSGEIVVVDASRDGTLELARSLGCRALPQSGRTYGDAFRQGLEETRGQYVVTLDADHSHEPEFLYHMWAVRDSADVIIGSRYVPAGSADMALSRQILSRALNRVFALVLGLPYRDLSSGYRLYRRRVLETVKPLTGKNFDALQEALVKAHCAGWRIREVPICYQSRNKGRSNAQAVRFAVSYLRTLRRLWRVRNSANACDHEIRAFHSWLPPRRYWARQRFKRITGLIREHGRCLDIGCGSSRIIQSLPAMVGLDINRSKLRFLRRTNPWLAQASAFALPFRDGIFSAVACSGVLSQVPKSNVLLEEMNRVLAAGGTLVLGAPDSSSRAWKFIGRSRDRVMPSGEAEEGITRYTKRDLLEALPRQGFEVISLQHVSWFEVIIEARKRSHPAAAIGDRAP